jgi:hypothetical protein
MPASQLMSCVSALFICSRGVGSSSLLHPAHFFLQTTQNGFQILFSLVGIQRLLIVVASENMFSIAANDSDKETGYD